MVGGPTSGGGSAAGGGGAAGGGAGAGSAFACFVRSSSAMYPSTSARCSGVMSFALRRYLAETDDRLVGVAEVLMTAGDVAQIGRVQRLRVQPDEGVERLFVFARREVHPRLHLVRFFTGRARSAGERQQRDHDHRRRPRCARRVHWQLKLTQEPLQQLCGALDAHGEPVGSQVWQVPLWQVVPDTQCELLEQLVGQAVLVPLQR